MDLLGALGTFVRVVEAGSFSAAARETGSSQSAVTRLIDHLEDHFGVRLFHRTTRRLNLTEDGQELLGHARQLIELTEAMEGELRQQRSTPTGLVRVGAPFAATPWVIARLPELRERYPGLRVDLVINDRFRDLIDQRLDMALIGGDPPDSSLVARRLGAFGRIPVASAAYLERHGAPAHPSELAQHTCIIHDFGPNSATWRFTGPQGAIEVQVTGVLQANNSGVIHRAALAGIGIAYMSELQVAEDLRASRLRRLLTDYEPVRQPIYVVYPSRRYLAPRVRVMIDFLAKNLPRLIVQEIRLGTRKGNEIDSSVKLER
jgi:DNA-binding transcriptional LysR family regulator